MAIHSRAQQLAQRGEDRAASYVEGLGWWVLERNWRCRGGELDLVAYDPAQDTLVFVEVKCRSGYTFGHPLEAITAQKAARLWGLAFAWMRERGARATNVRVDGIGIVICDGRELELTHTRGVEAG